MLVPSDPRCLPEGVAVPIVQAPMAGGPSTPALAASVSEAGGLGFLATGYRTTAQVAAELDAVRGLTRRPFGVNVFVPGPPAPDAEAVAAYAAAISADAAALGAPLGTPTHDDDGYEDKLALLQARPPAVVSFTFGCPSRRVVAAAQDAGSRVWVTVTDPGEARAAAAAGADALVVQGSEAGGHQASFVDTLDRAPARLLALLALVGDAVALPLVAAGGLMTGEAIAAALAAGAGAAALGTAFMSTPEAGTAAALREVLGTDRQTGLTRAYTGRLARGIVNRFQADHPDAPIAYPELHHLTSPLRAVARAQGDTESFNLWAGEAHGLTRPMPAARLVETLVAEIAAADDHRAPG